MNLTVREMAKRAFNATRCGPGGTWAKLSPKAKDRLTRMVALALEQDRSAVRGRLTGLLMRIDRALETR